MYDIPYGGIILTFSFLIIQKRYKEKERKQMRHQTIRAIKKREERKLSRLLEIQEKSNTARRSRYREQRSPKLGDLLDDSSRKTPTEDQFS